MIEKFLYYTIEQNDEEKSVVAYKRGERFFQITWNKPPTKTQIKKYAPKILKRAWDIVVRDSLLDMCNEMKDIPDESVFSDCPIGINEGVV